jgi:general stress protein YciG
MRFFADCLGMVPSAGADRKRKRPMANQDKTSEGRSKGGQESGGNFKNDPQRASEAGKKGGEQSHGGRK